MCKDPIAFESLAAYWLGELPVAEGEKLEEHLFACAHCAGRLEWLAALSAGVRAAVRAGALGLVVSAPFVEAMKRAGMRLREYRLGPGGSVNCTIRADEDAVVSRIGAPLAGVRRIDMLQRVEVGGVEQPEVRLEDVPFDPRSGEVLFIPPPAALKKMPAHRFRVRLVSVGEAGEAQVGEYTFAHSPS
jgi:Putative zinc-finger